MTQIDPRIKKVLNDEGFDNEQIEKFVTLYQEEYQKHYPPKKTPNATTDFWTRGMDFIQKNPDIIKKFIPNSGHNLLFQFGVALIILSTITFLAVQDILGTCETSTILGGAVGYLIGHKTG